MRRKHLLGFRRRVLLTLPDGLYHERRHWTEHLRDHSLWVFRLHRNGQWGCVQLPGRQLGQRLELKCNVHAVRIGLLLDIVKRSDLPELPRRLNDSKRWLNVYLPVPFLCIGLCVVRTSVRIGHWTYVRVRLRQGFGR